MANSDQALADSKLALRAHPLPPAPPFYKPLFAPKTDQKYDSQKDAKMSPNGSQGDPTWSPKSQKTAPNAQKRHPRTGACRRSRKNGDSEPPKPQKVCFPLSGSSISQIPPTCKKYPKSEPKGSQMSPKVPQSWKNALRGHSTKATQN